MLSEAFVMTNVSDPQTQARAWACGVRGLLYGDCSAPADSARKDGLCLYHGKLTDRLTTPPGDYVDNPEFPSTAAQAHASYRGSSHPQFAGMVDTGGYELAATAA